MVKVSQGGRRYLVLAGVAASAGALLAIGAITSGLAESATPTRAEDAAVASKHPKTTAAATQGIRGQRIDGTPRCVPPKGWGSVALRDAPPVTAFRLCYASDGSAPLSSVTLTKASDPKSFASLAKALSAKDHWSGVPCPMIAVAEPYVYAHTSNGWWMVHEPLAGCTVSPVYVHLMGLRYPAGLGPVPR